MHRRAQSETVRERGRVGERERERALEETVYSRCHESERFFSVGSSLPLG